MKNNELPGCCAAQVLWNLVFPNIELGIHTVKAFLEENEEQKLFIATTAVGGGDNKPGHRQHEESQIMAEKVLKACGFRCLKAVKNKLHHHPDTGVRLWWLRNEK